jgi:hypothetical protein
LERYIEVCLAGRVYERLAELTGYPREVVKNRWCAVVYGEPWKAVRTVTGRAFASEWPGVWDMVRRVNGGDNATLARQLQTVESYLVVRRVCSRLVEVYPDAPLLTLHDSLVTDEAHVEAFQAVLVSEFNTVFGVEPRVKTKPFADVSVSNEVATAA